MAIKNNIDVDVLSRFPGNPIVSLDDVPFWCSDIWNAAVTRFEDIYLMLITVEELEGIYHIYRAESGDGLNFTFDETGPVFCDGLPDEMKEYQTGGARDPRITPINGSFYVTYIAESRHGHRVCLTETSDFKRFKYYPYASQVDVKNGAVFPELIDGRYCLLKRPCPGGSIWIAFSEDLEFWGDDKCVMRPRGGFWDASRIGPACTPLKHEMGWVFVYYGVKDTSAGPLVRLGVALLDEKQPWNVIGRSVIPILSPREPYERLGDVPNVVFSCGAVHDGDLLHVYYGASDSCVCRSTARVDKLIDSCLNGD